MELSKAYRKHWPLLFIYLFIYIQLHTTQFTKCSRPSERICHILCQCYRAKIVRIRDMFRYHSNRGFKVLFCVEDSLLSDPRSVRMVADLKVWTSRGLQLSLQTPSSVRSTADWQKGPQVLNNCSYQDIQCIVFQEEGLSSFSFHFCFLNVARVLCSRFLLLL